MSVYPLGLMKEDYDYNLLLVPEAARWPFLSCKPPPKMPLADWSVLISNNYAAFTEKLECTKPSFEFIRDCYLLEPRSQERQIDNFLCSFLG
jgi:hypothetical protein